MALTLFTSLKLKLLKCKLIEKAIDLRNYLVSVFLPFLSIIHYFKYRVANFLDALTCLFFLTFFLLSDAFKW